MRTVEKAQQKRLVVLRTMDGCSVREIRDELESLLAPINEKPPSVSTIHAWQKAAERRGAAEAALVAALPPSLSAARAPRQSTLPETQIAPTITSAPTPAQTAPAPPPDVLQLDPDELADTDPRRVRDRSIGWYTKMIGGLRKQAEIALVANRFREARDIGALARTYEERRDELLPAPAPDPDKDPAYRKASEQIILDLREVMKALQRKDALPTRTTPEVTMVQPS